MRVAHPSTRTGLYARSGAAESGSRSPSRARVRVRTAAPGVQHLATMVIGQLGAAFAAKAIAPRISLGTLFCAALLLSLVGPLEDAPVFVLVGPFVAGAAYWVRTRQSESALIVAACTLVPAILGLCPAGVELVAFGAGAAFYLWRTQGIDRFGALGAVFLAAVVIAARAVDWTIGPLSAAALTALATWIDRHREPRFAMRRAARAPDPPEDPPEAEPDPDASAPVVPLPSRLRPARA